MSGERESGGTSAGAQSVKRLFGAAVKPFQAFFELEASSGILLLACAVAALAWVNLIDPPSYHRLLEFQLQLGAGTATTHFSLHALVNVGLMAVFFFLVGMEIKRELAVGELSTLGQALLPAVAAVGGMILPAGIFLLVNWGGPGQHGWGIPMATDIAFCVGALALLRSRVPRALVVFVTALAIFDDIGGILVIALFYGHGLHWPWLAAAAALTLGLVGMSRAYVRSAVAWSVMGLALWFALGQGGIHATIAGVVLGLTIPARPRARPREVLAQLAEHVASLCRGAPDEELERDAVLQVGERLDALEPPLDRFEEALHPWVAFGVMPLFALANAGVELRGMDASHVLGPVAVGVAMALVVGKLVGIFGFTFLTVKTGLSPMPGRASAGKLAGVSAVAGIGFTVALFIAGLAFPGAPDLLDEAKLGIIAGSLVAGIGGAALLLATPRLGPKPDPSRGAQQDAA
jgi:NhaA family Na+:H+ antiporter